MSRHLPRFALVVALLTVTTPAPAAVVVLANYTAQDVSFTLTHPGRPAKPETLAAGQVKPFTCGPRVDVRFTSAGKLVALQLDPFEAYVFTGNDKAVSLSGIELAGKPVPTDDIRPITADEQPVTIPVKLLVDDADRRTRRAWEPAIRRRFTLAADLIAGQCPVRFTVANLDEWPSDPAATDMDAVMKGFRKAARPEPAKVVVGFTSRFLGVKAEPGQEPPFGQSAGLQSHLLIREGDPRSEAERVEVLASHLAAYLGAVPSPDPASMMRGKLGDGKAASAKFRVQMDPLNVLATNLWAEAMRAKPVSAVADLPAATQARLRRVYETLANAQPDEPVAAVAAALLPRARGQAADPPAAVEVKPPVEVPAPAVKPARTDVAKADTARIDAVRKVVTAVVIVAETNATGAKLRGDELTNQYIKTAAGVARFEDADHRAAAFLLGLGIALDDSEILRKNPLAAAFCTKVESDDERTRRLKAVGTPTLRGRRDLCQHFVVSAYLAESVGPALAEQAGLAKELIDMTRPSGFSFSDLCADLAGVEFAKLVKRRPELLEEYPLVFNVNDFAPKMDGLRDGLSAERFKADYGVIGDERFQAAFADVRKRVAALPAYAK